MGNCFLLDDVDAAAISNWQEVAKGGHSSSRRGAASFPMSRRYAEGAERQAATLRTNMLRAFVSLAEKHAATKRGGGLDRAGVHAGRELDMGSC